MMIAGFHFLVNERILRVLKNKFGIDVSAKI